MRVGGEPASRELTSRERAFVIQLLRSKRSEYRLGAFLLAAFSCIQLLLIVLLILPKMTIGEIGFLFPGVLFLTGFAFSVYWIFHLYRQAKLRELNLRSLNGVERLKGLYRSESVFSGRTRRIYRCIGNTVVVFPNHWMPYLSEGANVEVEYFALDPVYNARRNTITFSEENNYVLSLDGRYSIDRDVSCGLLAVRPATRLTLSVLFACIIGIVSFAVAMCSGTPANSFRAWRYANTPAKEYETVDAALSDQNLVSGTPLIIRNASCSVDENLRVVLFSPIDQDQSALFSFFAKCESSDSSASVAEEPRESIRQKLEALLPTILFDRRYLVVDPLFYGIGDADTVISDILRNRRFNSVLSIDGTVRGMFVVRAAGSPPVFDQSRNSDDPFPLLAVWIALGLAAIFCLTRIAVGFCSFQRSRMILGRIRDMYDSNR
jgi:hypothetical protein